MQPKDDFNAKRRMNEVRRILGDDFAAASRTPEEQEEMRQLLDKMKKAREADPNWEKALKKVAEAEARYGKDDPAEGKVFIEKVQAPKRSK
jgi:DNA-binding FadR family transcriptional regulator